jgi:cytochrome bd-type quinol oxidase subunit 1
VLPKKWFRDVFVARGASLAILGLAYMIYLANQFQTKEDYPSISLKLWSVSLAVGLIMLGTFFAGRISVVRKILEVFSDRATIFLYISIPLSLISLLVVLDRLIF